MVAARSASLVGGLTFPIADAASGSSLRKHCALGILQPFAGGRNGVFSTSSCLDVDCTVHVALCSLIQMGAVCKSLAVTVSGPQLLFIDILIALGWQNNDGASEAEQFCGIPTASVVLDQSSHTSPRPSQMWDVVLMLADGSLCVGLVQALAPPSVLS